MEKPKNLGTWTKVGEHWWEGGAGQRGIKGRKKWDKCNSVNKKIYFKPKQNKENNLHFPDK